MHTVTPSRPTADAPDRKRARYSFLDSSPSACIPYFAYFVEIVWGQKQQRRLEGATFES
jgi:hypothetical protein